MPLNRELLVDYKTRYFIETGTHGGQGVLMALKYGYKDIRSVEVDDKLYKEAKKIVGGHDEVTLYLGDTRDKLWEMIKDIDEQMTVWLDAHAPITVELRDKHGRQPILDELDMLAKHPVNDHNILIDDINEFGTFGFDHIELDEVKNRLYKINKDYKMTFGGNNGEVLIAHG